ncbi:hypothetical protein [Cloacibacterium sp. TD35]|uniref:hypothetical protein n=1 Tax=Cloacibacterium sp. TD35 TaxID=2976818 RepID=UPI00237E3475|nr:hypothetical protein [Cloacibacterium sp. TD35]WDT67199.1 hypothetical protein N7277_07610 [Cloacibacterium sp. TD35]
MKKNLKFLVCGLNDEILIVLKRLLEKEQWHVTIAKEETEAIQFISEKKIDILFLSSGLTQKTEENLKAAAENFKVKVIEHYGGGSGLLKTEVYQLFPEEQDTNSE